jgi:hypothetical protein
MSLAIETEPLAFKESDFIGHESNIRQNPTTQSLKSTETLLGKKGWLEAVNGITYRSPR